MSFIVRPVEPRDLEALYQMAKSTGGGFTNLPPDRPTLKGKVERSAASFARKGDDLADDFFMFVLENAETGKVRGTNQIFARIGSTWPFYSYRISTMTQSSKELNRTFRAEMLTLCTDLDGSSEIGGLFLHPGERSAGIGKLLARSRYMFIGMHRERFADRTLAELRGALDEAGSSPFWDGVPGRFFGMSFQEADNFNALNGNQFIADLMPKHPIYTAMVPETARAVMGMPHHSGRAAMRMLEEEGFRYDGYIDIFDGGPTMVARTDRIKAIRKARTLPVTATGDRGEMPTHLIAHGRLGQFRACLGDAVAGDEGVVIDRASAGMLGVGAGDSVMITPR
ncbi:MAG: arginine N-succinyltransferase [Novosphingobium sp.]|nr:arginine N-succinyltransferase [Novosphingobium sp.]